MTNNLLAKHRCRSWYEATARERVAALVDSGSFTEFIGPEKRETSPHLALFDLPEAFDDGIIVGRGKVQGRDILIAAQEATRCFGRERSSAIRPSGRLDAGWRARLAQTAMSRHYGKARRQACSRHDEE